MPRLGVHIESAFLFHDDKGKRVCGLDFVFRCASLSPPASMWVYAGVLQGMKQPHYTFFSPLLLFDPPASTPTELCELCLQVILLGLVFLRFRHGEVGVLDLKVPVELLTDVQAVFIRNLRHEVVHLVLRRGHRRALANSSFHVRRRDVHCLELLLKGVHQPANFGGVHRLQHLVHTLHHLPHVLGHHLHLDSRVEPGHNGIHAGRQTKVVERLVLLADAVLGVDAGPIHVVLFHCLLALVHLLFLLLLATACVLEELLRRELQLELNVVEFVDRHCEVL
ncbi:hypothetical protein, conserved [Leishmania tarentolae]|uniref:Uncharacterized protein n=1 Tax=Leishmania tarentolae TaxID=5689 RepID=A0A640KT84_LEITA|nr:hypothetical protein, conserved [Leishmania tarentolae]